MAARTATTKSTTTDDTAPATPVETTPAAPAETGPSADVTATVKAAADTPVKTLRFDADTLTKIKSAPAWRPTDGQTVNGKIVTVVKRTGEYGPYPCVILDTNADKFVAVHAFHGVLQNELREMKAQPGDDITILYTGKRTANRLNLDGSEKKYHGYSVVPTDGGDLDVFDFDAFDADKKS